MIRAILTLFFLALASCYHANGAPFTPAEVGHEAVVIAHDAARVLCLARPLEAVLAVSSGLTLEPAMADAFCGMVAAVETSLAHDAMRVIRTGSMPLAPPTYSVSASGFSVKAGR